MTVVPQSLSLITLGLAASAAAFPSPLDTSSSAAKLTPIESSRGSGMIEPHGNLPTASALLPQKQQQDRQLQDANYQASYLARFQQLSDGSVCSAPNPTIQLFCFGSMVPMSISDGSIQCVPITEGDWTGMECSNTCDNGNGIGLSSGTPCEQVFLEDSNVGSGQFGEIVFQCVGEGPEDVDAYMNFVGGDPGSCTAATDSSTNSRNFHVAQLGVFCQDASNGAGAYVFDDKDFECGLGNSPAKIDGSYTCLDGTNCEGSACTVEFTDLIVDADHHNFYDCIQSLNDAMPVPEAPAKDELIAPAVPGEYSATFQANWKLKLDTTVCGGDFATKRLSCPNGRISFVEALADNVNCTKVSPSELECRDTSALNFVNEFSGAVFRCDSTDAIPEAKADYLPANSLCETTEPKYVAHYIQLGVRCEDTVNGIFTSYADYLFECGDDNEYEVLSGRYTCSGENHFGPDSDIPSGQVRPLPEATVYTDFRWSRGAYDICYSFEGRLPPTQAPQPCAGGGVFGLGIGFGGGTSADCTDAPTTPSPTTAITAAPVTMAPVFVGTPAPTRTDPPTAAPVTAAPVPVAPDGTTFFADYRARFKRIVDDGCESPESESVVVVCENGKIEIDTDRTSDGIFCTPPDDFEGGEFTACLLSCTGQDCDDLYIDRESLRIFSIWVINENYAEIFFRCSGDNENAVDAGYFISGSEDTGATGSCTANSAGGQNLLLGELNVECPDEVTGDPVFVNSHAYSECGSGVVPLNVNGNYTCLTGEICGDSACLVEYEDVLVEADHHRFQQCIQTDPPGFMVPQPVVEVDDDRLQHEPGQYTAQFQVGTEFWYDEDSCEAQNTGVRITCVDGTINLINAESGMECATVSDNEIECTETDFTVRNEAVDVAEYECTSNDVVPQTRVEYLSTDIGCDSSSQEQATRYVNLGVLCGDPGDQSYFASDLFFECALDNEYTIRTDDTRFSCYSRVQVPENSNNEPITIPPAQAFSDYRWAFFSNDICFSYKAPTTATSRMIEQGEFRKVAKAKASSGGKTSSSSSAASTGSSSESSGSNPDLGINGGSSNGSPLRGFSSSSPRQSGLVAGLVAFVAAAAMTMV